MLFEEHVSNTKLLGNFVFRSLPIRATRIIFTPSGTHADASARMHMRMVWGGHPDFFAQLVVCTDGVLVLVLLCSKFLLHFFRPKFSFFFCACSRCLEVINSARAQRSGMQRLLVALHHLQEIRLVVMNRARAQRIGMQRLLVANHHVQEIRPVTARPGLLKPGGFCM